MRPDKFVYAIRPAAGIAEAVVHALRSLGVSTPERVESDSRREPDLAA